MSEIEAQELKQKQDVAKKVDLVAINRTPQGKIAVGLVDRTRQPPRNLYLNVGDGSFGYKILEADFSAETAVVEYNGVTIKLGLGKGLISENSEFGIQNSESPAQHSTLNTQHSAKGGEALNTQHSTPNASPNPDLRPPTSDLPPPSFHRPVLRPGVGGFRERKRAANAAEAKAEAERRAAEAKAVQERTKAAIDAAVNSAVEQTLQEVEARMQEGAIPQDGYNEDAQYPEGY